MASVGKLVAILEARTAKFERGMGKAQKKIRDLGGVARKIGGTLLTVLGGTALIATISRLSREIDMLAKAASKLGTTTQELSALRFAAQQTGIAINTFDMAIQRMTRRIGEAAIGTGEAKAAIKELGLDAKQLLKLPLTERLKQIADAMVRVENQAHRVRLSFKLFDSEGVALVNLLATGSIGINKFIAEAKRLGIVIDDKTAASIVRARDSIMQMKASLTASLAPAIASITTAVKNLSSVVQESGKTLLKIGGVIVGTIALLKAFKAATKAAAAAQAILLALSGPKGWLQLAGALAVAAGSLVAVDKAFAGVQDAAADAADEAARAGAEIEALAIGARPTGEQRQLARINKEIRSMVPEIRAVKAEIERLEQSQIAAANRMFGESALLNEMLVESMLKATERSQELTERMRELQEVRKKLIKILEAQREKDEAAARAQEESEKKAKNLADAVADLEERLRVQIATIGDSAEAVLAYKLGIEGATEAQLETVRALIKELELRRQERDLKKELARIEEQRRAEAERLAESAETPLERMNRELEHLKKLADDFPDIITPEIHERAAEKIRKAFEETTEEFKKMERLRDLARQVIENTRTPLERFKRQMEDLRKLLEEKLISPEVFERAVQAARDELERATGTDAGRDGSFGTARSVREIQFKPQESFEAKQLRIANERINKILAGMKDLRVKAEVTLN